MKFSLKTLVAPSFVLCAAAAFAANTARVDLPFSFTAQGKSYPAGRYEVTTDLNHNFVTLASHADASKHLTWMIWPSEPASAPAVVTFDVAGSDHMLKTVQLGNRITTNLDKHPKAGLSATTSIGGQ